MKEYSIIMSLVDFIPVVMFAVSTAILQKEFYTKMKQALFSLFSAGTISIVFAGGLKAAYKLLYALGICDFQALSSIFMPLQSIGFILAGISVILMISENKKSKTLAAAAVPAPFSGTMIFVGLMVSGLGLMCFGLSVYAKRIKKSGAILLFVVTFICLLCMGYLSSRDFSKAIYNWLAEAINVIGQTALLAGSVMISKKKTA